MADKNDLATPQDRFVFIVKGALSLAGAEDITEHFWPGGSAAVMFKGKDGFHRAVAASEYELRNYTSEGTLLDLIKSRVENALSARAA